MSIPARLVAGHAFSFGTPVVVHVQDRGVGIVDDSGAVLWESARDDVRLSGAGSPGFASGIQPTTLRGPDGRKKYLVFADPKPGVYLSGANLVVTALC